MRKLISILSIFTLSFLYACETEINEKNDTNCTICGSYCCDQVGTNNCCCEVM